MGVAKFFSSVRSWAKTSQSRRKIVRRARLQIETLEAREVLTLNPTGYQQEMLELLNHMRMDPAGELRRLLTSTNPIQSPDPDVQAALQYFGVSGSALASQWASLVPTAPLAWNDALMSSSAAHNQAMIAADQQSHQLPGEASLGSRATQAGYTNWNTLGENIYAYADSIYYGHAGFAIDWGTGVNGLQNPAGHRLNMMNGNFREVGIAVMQDSNPNSEVGPYVITQDFGNRSNIGNSYLLGVVYNDSNHDGRYEAGEGLGNVNITIRGTQNTYFISTLSAGGYQLQVPSGSYTVTFTGSGITTPITQTVAVGTTNVKLDVISGVTSGGNGGGSTPSNHAPVLNATMNFALPAILQTATNPVGTRISTLIGTAISDADANALKGIAIIAANGVSGTWQYSINGSTWQALNSVSSSSALLLRSTDFVRFVPNGVFSGRVNFTFRAWDQTSGGAGSFVNVSTIGGSSAFSSASAQAIITVTLVNHAPVLDTSRPFNLTPVNNSGLGSNPGTIVSAFLGNSITDQDSSALRGIAVTGLTGTTQGTWQFSLDSGRSWTNFGTTSAGTVRLLRPTDMIRFVPRASFTGRVSLQFRAWDQTRGVAGGTLSLISLFGSTVGGTTAFSSAVGMTWLSVV